VLVLGLHLGFGYPYAVRTRVKWPYRNWWEERLRVARTLYTVQKLEYRTQNAVSSTEEDRLRSVCHHNDVIKHCSPKQPNSVNYTVMISYLYMPHYMKNWRHPQNRNNAIVDIRLRPRCAIAQLTLYTFLTQVPLMLN